MPSQPPSVIPTHAGIHPCYVNFRISLIPSRSLPGCADVGAKHPRCIQRDRLARSLKRMLSHPHPPQPPAPFAALHAISAFHLLYSQAKGIAWRRAEDAAHPAEHYPSAGLVVNVFIIYLMLIYYIYSYFIFYYAYALRPPHISQADVEHAEPGGRRPFYNTG
jgi:hypothetical protein